MLYKVCKIIIRQYGVVVSKTETEVLHKVTKNQNKLVALQLTIYQGVVYSPQRAVSISLKHKYLDNSSLYA